MSLISVIAIVLAFGYSIICIVAILAQMSLRNACRYYGRSLSNKLLLPHLLAIYTPDNIAQINTKLITMYHSCIRYGSVYAGVFMCNIMYTIMIVYGIAMSTTTLTVIVICNVISLFVSRYQDIRSLNEAHVAINIADIYRQAKTLQHYVETLEETAELYQCSPEEMSQIISDAALVLSQRRDQLERLGSK